MATHERLADLEDLLASQCADRLRLELVRRARIFKRSWVEMAEGLHKVRNNQLYSDWGYKDLYSYCSQELLLTKGTVEKLLGSFGAIREHAPQVLQRDGLEQPVPNLDSVEYFAKALRTHDDDEDDFTAERPDEEAWTDLKKAVFDDDAPVSELRKSFNPVFFPAKPEDEGKLREKTRAAARRLEGLLGRVKGIDGTALTEALQALSTLRKALDAADAPADQAEAS
ncbi:MAG: hypothetical protein CMN30_20520 [Sandaracinus sp.]|nr:hypothetical protein [Sandaracinus sp.]|tara:strand:+ start:240 stop:917 length:678 start_codon:yes stop_codon:yes gene_type:complete